MLVQLRDQAGIGFIKLQKCLAPSDLLRGDGLAREIHSPVSRYVAADGEGDVRLACLLACLLAQYFFHDMPALYLFWFAFCAKLRCDLFPGCPLSHGLMRLYRFAMAQASVMIPSDNGSCKAL